MCQRLSAWVAMRCKEPQFRQWLRVPDEATAITAVRAICEVKSRAELDTNPTAAQRFHQFIRLPFADYSQPSENKYRQGERKMILVLDTETTGIDEPQCIELAHREVVLRNGLIESPNESAFCQRFLPSKPISYGAMATHHIQLKDLEGCPPHKEAKIPSGTAYLVGHNIDFDWKVLGSPDIRRIDTLAMARRMWPDMDSHKLGAIVYRLWPESAAQRLRDAHSAAADVDMCVDVLAHMCKMIRPESIEALYEYSEKARVPTVMSFGKHKGQAIATIPSDYKRWLLNQPDIDPYLIKALRTA